VNLYGFVGNSSISFIDKLGLTTMSTCEADESCGESMSCLPEFYEGTDVELSATYEEKVRGQWKQFAPPLVTTASPSYFTDSKGGFSFLDAFTVVIFYEEQVSSIYVVQDRTSHVRYIKWCTVYNKDRTIKCDGYKRRTEIKYDKYRNDSGKRVTRTRTRHVTHQVFTGVGGPVINEEIIINGDDKGE
jgi:hypothetical protein